MAVCFTIIPRSSTDKQDFPAERDSFHGQSLATGHLLSIILFSIIFLLFSVSSLAGVVRPLEGDGNFHSYFDVLNRWQSEDRLDVLVLVEITNADINYEESGNGFVGKFNFEVTLEGPDGKTITKKRHMSTPKLDAVLAASRTSFQVFGLVLEDVPFREGRLTCTLHDALSRKQGILNRSTLPVSESVIPWSADHRLRTEGGVTVGDPLFLAHAPLKSWDPAVTSNGAGAGYLHDYIHPSRRYGIEEDRLQLFIPVWPSTGYGTKPDEHSGLQIQIRSEDMVYAITDTLQFDNLGIVALESGRPAGLMYELDLNVLPEGSYRMAIAPLNRKGKGQLVMFDVVWRLGAVGSNRDRILGEGRMVFSGKDLAVFLDANPVGQEKLLADFWTSLNPDPESPINSVYIEFLYRQEYVQKFLGGFGRRGANDPRGEVYLLLGPPDDVEREIMPMNSSDLEDAQVKTFDQFAPDREGSGAKGGADVNQPGSTLSDPSMATGGIPMPRSSMAQRQIMLSYNTSHNSNGYELWKYDSGGKPLFDNYLMDEGMWQRFLFVDRTGAGDYYLESSNTLQGGD